ncbi:hypothetical protein O6H91_11G020600 [Diphasiastrum complanatum]|uniref:Uncharacterized protein n=1 Tax=Diphasiastrum complanatum TaxID=34168 RepID=A0ACC2C6Y3_DIPCM|nr:hypothetical protein O6H91_11G020600 [Diphasiastrum complanatum]
MGVSKFLDSSGLNSIAAAACIFNKHHFSLSDSPHAHTGARTHTHAHSRSRKQEEGELRYNNKEQEMEEVAAGDSRAAINSATLRAILQQARNFLDEGKPSLALQAVIAALRATGGEQSVFKALTHARNLHQQQRRQEIATDELTALFAECAIAEVSGGTYACNQSHQHSTSASENTAELFREESMGLKDSGDILNRLQDSILAESGRTQVVLDASQDGSSYTCFQCGGIVSNMRRDEHAAFWCTARLS